MKIQTQKNRIVPSTDKLVISFKIFHYFFLYKYFRILTPLYSYSFENLPKKVLSFKKVKFTRLYNKDQLKKHPNRKFQYRYQIQYKDNEGRKFHFNYKLPKCPLTGISFEFYPTLRADFDYRMILEILEAFGLNPRDFHISSMECSWDFYGPRYKNIGNKIWSKSNRIGFGYEDSDGKGKCTPDPNEVPQDQTPTIYLGKNYSTLQLKIYDKEEEGGLSPNRVEATVFRTKFRDLGINHLDAIVFGYEKVIDYIFRSFSIRRLIRKNFTHEFSGTDRFFNKLKGKLEKYKAKILCERFPDEIQSISDFEKRFTEKLDITETCKNKILKYFKNTFLKKIDEYHLKQMRKIREQDKKQLEIEEKLKSIFENQVKAETKKAKENLDPDPLFPLEAKILKEIRKFLCIEKLDIYFLLQEYYLPFENRYRYCYLGTLNGLLKSILMAKNFVGRKKREIRDKILNGVILISGVQAD